MGRPCLSQQSFNMGAHVQNRAAAPYVSMMKKGEDAAVSVREAVAGLWRKGAALAWDVPAGPVAGTL